MNDTTLANMIHNDTDPSAGGLTSLVTTTASEVLSDQGSTTEYFNETVTTTADLYKDFFPGDLQLHEHWYQYVDEINNIPNSAFYALGVYIGFVGIIGILGNLLVIYIFSTTKGLRTPPNMYIVNLAISDLGFSLAAGFPLMTIASFQRRWQWGKLACELYAFLCGVFGFVSINTLAVVSVDRYIAIAKPFHAMKHSSKKKSLLNIAIVWIVSTVWCCPPFFGWGTYVAEGMQVACSFDYLSRDWGTLIFNHCMFWFGFTLPICIIIYSYYNIIRAVGSQGREIMKTAEKLKAQTDDRSRQQEIQMAKIAFVSVTLFFLSWFPYAIVAQLGVWNRPEFLTPYMAQIPVMFAKTSALWNPIMYALTHPKFRAQLDKRFPLLLCCPGRNVDSGTQPATSTVRKEPSKAPGRRPPKLNKTDSVLSVDTTNSDMYSSETSAPDETIVGDSTHEMYEMSPSPNDGSGAPPAPPPPSSAGPTGGQAAATVPSGVV